MTATSGWSAAIRASSSSPGHVRHVRSSSTTPDVVPVEDLHHRAAVLAGEQVREPGRALEA